MNGLALILGVSDSWLVGDSLFEQALQLYGNKDFDMSGYLSSRRAEVIAQEKELRTLEASLSEPINSEQSHYSSVLSSTGTLAFRLQGEMVRRTSSFSSSGIQMDAMSAHMDRIMREHKSGIKDVKKVVFLWDSPGGDAIPAFQLHQKVKELKQYVKTYSFNRGSMMSAAVLVGIATSEGVWSSDFAEIGSVGAAVSLRSFAKANASEGVEIYVATSGSKKRLLSSTDAEGNISKDAKAYADEIALTLGTNFQNIVWSERPNITAENRTKIAEAGFYSAKDALDMGLIDGIMTENEFLDMVEAQSSSANTDPNDAEDNEMKDNQKKILSLFGELDSEMSSEEAVKIVSAGNAAIKLGLTADNIENKLSEGSEVGLALTKLGLSLEDVSKLSEMKNEIQTGLVSDCMKFYTASFGKDEKTPEFIAKKAKLEKLSLEELKESFLEMKMTNDVLNKSTGRRSTSDDSGELLNANELAFGKEA